MNKMKQLKHYWFYRKKKRIGEELGDTSVYVKLTNGETKEYIECRK